MDSVIKKYESYSPQVFLKECKHVKKKLVRHRIDDSESSPGDSDDSDYSDYSDEK